MPIDRGLIGYVVAMRGQAKQKPGNDSFRKSLPGLALSGGGDRDRTDGLSDANAALSQLSYTPTKGVGDAPGGGSDPVPDAGKG